MGLPNNLSQINALTFDVFGTTVDWRKPVESALADSLKRRVHSGESFAALPKDVQARACELAAPSSSATDADAPSSPWPAGFASEWRASYGRFTRDFVPGPTPWKDVDAHHLDSLRSLLADWGLPGLWPEGGEGDEHDEDTLLGLSRVWHRLDPWPDVREGLRLLRAGRQPTAVDGAGDGGGAYVTAMLSNGNSALLRNLDRQAHHSGEALGFARIFSAEEFGAYKPNPKIYLGAAEALGLPPGHVAMVAAHLFDLEGARKCGLRTVFVERPGEEPWKESEDRYKEAREWVDLWIPLGAGGFVELAKRLSGEQA